MSSAVTVLDCEQETKVDTHKTSGIALHRVSRIEAPEFRKSYLALDTPTNSGRSE